MQCSITGLVGVLCNVLSLVWLVFYAMFYYLFGWCSMQSAITGLIGALCNLISLVWLVLYAI